MSPAQTASGGLPDPFWGTGTCCRVCQHTYSHTQDNLNRMICHAGITNYVCAIETALLSALFTSPDLDPICNTHIEGLSRAI